MVDFWDNRANGCVNSLRVEPDRSEPSEATASLIPIKTNHTFTVVATDWAGNTASDSFIWTVDLTNPDTAITAHPSDPSNSANASFSFTGSDPGGSGVAGFECQIDGGGYSACTSPKSYAGLSEGSHTFDVRAIDSVGNVDGTPASFTWVVDTTAPDTIIDTAPADPGNSPNVSVSFHGTDTGGSGVASYQYRTSTDAGSTWSSATSGCSRPPSRHRSATCFPPAWLVACRAGR